GRKTAPPQQGDAPSAPGHGRRSAIAQQHIPKQCAQKEPLRHPARPLGAWAWHGYGFERDLIEYLRGRNPSTTGSPSARRRRDASVTHDHRSDAGIVESPQHGTDVELAGPTQIDEKLNRGGYGLAQLPRELVSPRLTLRLCLPRQQVESLRGQGGKQAIERGIEPLKLAIGVKACGG